MVTTAKGESRDRACTGMTEPQQLVLEEHSLSASRRFVLKQKYQEYYKKRSSLRLGVFFTRLLD